jgi:hypothetical protein
MSCVYRLFGVRHMIPSVLEEFGYKIVSIHSEDGSIVIKGPENSSLKSILTTRGIIVKRLSYVPLRKTHVVLLHMWTLFGPTDELILYIVKSFLDILANTMYIEDYTAKYLYVETGILFITLPTEEHAARACCTINPVFNDINENTIRICHPIQSAKNDIHGPRVRTYSYVSEPIDMPELLDC